MQRALTKTSPLLHCTECVCLSPSSLSSLLTQTLLDAKVISVKDACVAISTEATQEAALEELLAKVTTKWAAIEFSVIPYKDSKDVYILGAIDEIQVNKQADERVQCVPGVHTAALCVDGCG